jgi:hypothetical protein
VLFLAVIPVKEKPVDNEKQAGKESTPSTP